jgi:hypothetical protein
MTLRDTLDGVPMCVYVSIDVSPIKVNTRVVSDQHRMNHAKRKDSVIGTRVKLPQKNIANN